MIVKTEAIVLRLNAFSRTSRVVTWLTPDFGRVVTVIKGACRPKSAFLGQYDLAMRCELLFYRKSIDGVHIARECTPIDCRLGLRDDWRAAVAAGYLCELAGRVSQPMLDAHAGFGLLDRALTALENGAPPAAAILRFEFGMLAALGLAPDFSRCTDCGADGADTPCRFSLESGRLRCRHSQGCQPGQASVALDNGLLAALRVWQSPPPADSQEPIRFPAATTIAVRRFLGMFMQCHLDPPPALRLSVFAWLDGAKPGEAEPRQGK